MTQTSQRFMTHPAGYGATGLILHEEANAILLKVLLFEPLERHCCSSPYDLCALGSAGKAEEAAGSTAWNLVAIFRIQITETQLISARMSARRPTKEVDAKQGFGVMSRFPHCALVRSYVLNNLENGPARVADLVRRGQAEFGFSHSEIEDAAKHFAVFTRVKKGEIYWMRPANLIAIWWGLGRDPRPFRRSAGRR